jgi:hypothetical protein
MRITRQREVTVEVSDRNMRWCANGICPFFNGEYQKCGLYQTKIDLDEECEPVRVSACFEEFKQGVQVPGSEEGSGLVRIVKRVARKAKLGVVGPVSLGKARSIIRALMKGRLNNFGVRLDKDRRVTAYNLDVQVTLQVDESLSVGVQAFMRLGDFLNVKEIVVATDGSIIASGVSVAPIAEDLLLFADEAPDQGAMAMDTESLAWLCKAMSSDETRYNLNGFFCDKDCLVATDGHRLHKVDQSVPELLQGKIIPGMVAKVITSLKASWVDVVNVDPESGTWAGRRALKIGPHQIVFNLLNGQFPEHGRVIPTEPARAIATINRADLIKVKAACKVENQVTGAAICKCWLGVAGIALGAGNRILGESNMEGSVEIMANPDYLLDMTDADPIRLELIDDLSPIVLRGKGRIAIVMPMRM